jgi:hypothetical protein
MIINLLKGLFLLLATKARRHKKKLRFSNFASSLADPFCPILRDGIAVKSFCLNGPQHAKENDAVQEDPGREMKCGFQCRFQKIH